MTPEELTEAAQRSDRTTLSLCWVMVRDFGKFCDALDPDSAAEIDAYLKAEAEAVFAAEGGLLVEMGSGEMVGVFGATGGSRHHAFHALKAAGGLAPRFAAIRQFVSGQGAQLPPVGVVVHTGELLVVNPSSPKPVLIGAAADTARSLHVFSGEQKVLVSEAVMDEILERMPSSWEASNRVLEQATEVSSDLLLLNLIPLNDELAGRGVLISPRSAESSDSGYLFEYWATATVGVSGGNIVLLLVTPPQSQRVSEDEDLAGDAAPAETGHAFGKYRLIRKLGEGGMGEVWLARDRFRNQVAIKTLLPSHGASASQVRRLKREAEVMLKAAHRNICRIYDVGEVNGVFYIAMEYIEGVTLHELLWHGVGHESATASREASDLSAIVRTLHKAKIESASEALPDVAVEEVGESPQAAQPPKRSKVARTLLVPQVLAIATKMCEAVQYAHENGVLHRDLKPSNIMVRMDGDPVIMDFGLAKMEQSGRDLSLSISGQIFGTIEFMAPEQAVSTKDVDERADVFSLGSILYMMLAGKKLFQSTGNLAADAQALQALQPEAPSKFRKGLDPDLDIITLKAVSTDKAERYRSVRHLLDDIGRYQRGEPIAAKPLSLGQIFIKWVNRNRTLSATISSAALLLVVATIAFIIFLAREKEKATAAMLQAELAQQVAEESERQGRKRAEEADAARRDVERLLREVREEQQKQKTLLAQYEGEKQAKGEALLKLSQSEAEKVELAKGRAASDVQSEYSKAWMEFMEWHLGTAQDVLRGVLDKQPNHTSAKLLKVRILLSQLHISSAKKLMEELASDPDFVQTQAFKNLRALVSDAEAVYRTVEGATRDTLFHAALAKLMAGTGAPEDRQTAFFLHENIRSGGAVVAQIEDKP